MHSLIITMDSKSFIEEFSPRIGPDFVLDSSIIVVGKRIKVGTRYTDIVTKMTSMMPDPTTIVMCVNSKKDTKLKSNSLYLEEYLKTLDTNKLAFAKILKKMLKKEKHLIILTSEKENKTLNLLRIITYWLYSRFEYFAIPYKDGDFIYADFFNLFDDKVIKKRCNKIIKKAKKK